MCGDKAADIISDQEQMSEARTDGLCVETDLELFTLELDIFEDEPRRIWT